MARRKTGEQETKTSVATAIAKLTRQRKFDVAKSLAWLESEPTAVECLNRIGGLAPLCAKGDPPVALIQWLVAYGADVRAAGGTSDEKLLSAERRGPERRSRRGADGAGADVGERRRVGRRPQP